MAYIYKITNKINNKIYIGKTVSSIEERWKHHCCDGGIFFFRREDIPKIRVLKEKIVEETNRSIENATGFIGALQEELLEDNIDLDIMFDEDRLAFAVHADIGRRGKTKELIKEICAWIEASGFEARIKPDSYAASGVANMLSK